MKKSNCFLLYLLTKSQFCDTLLAVNRENNKEGKMRKIIVYSVIVAFLTVVIGGCATTGNYGRGYRYYHVRSRSGKVKIHEKHETEIGPNLASVDKLLIYTSGALIGGALVYLAIRNHKAKAKPEPKPEPKSEEGKRIMVCGGKKFFLKNGKVFEIQNGKISSEGKDYEIVDNRYLILEGKTVIDCN